MFSVMALDDHGSWLLRSCDNKTDRDIRGYQLPMLSVYMMVSHLVTKQKDSRKRSNLYCTQDYAHRVTCNSTTVVASRTTIFLYHIAYSCCVQCRLHQALLVCQSKGHSPVSLDHPLRSSGPHGKTYSQERYGHSESANALRKRMAHF